MKKNIKILKYTLICSVLCGLAVTNLLRISGMPLTNKTPTSLLLNDKKAAANTVIAPVANYPTHILSGQWEKLVNDNFNNLDIAKLSEFLDLSSVPEGAEYTITDLVPNLVTGKVTFKIVVSKHYSNSTLVDSPSSPFPITLNLSPQITTFTTRPSTDYPKMLADKIRAYIFAEDDTAIMNNFLKFVEIKAPVEGAILSLVPNSYADDLATGSVSFTVFYDKYYNASGIESTQTAATIAFPHVVTLNQLAVPTEITSIEGNPLNLRVDQFMTTLALPDGSVNPDSSNWGQYIKVSSLPANADLTVENINRSEYHLGRVSFDIKVSAYIDDNSVPQTNGIFPIALTLNPMFEPTVIRLRPSGSYDDTVRVDRLLPKFVANPNDKQEGLVTNLAELEKFVNIVSLPPNTTLSITDVDANYPTGLLKFNIEASHYYNSGFDYENTPHKFPITIQLVKRYEPSVIIAKDPVDITEVVRVDRFLPNFVDLATGAITDLNYLQKFINISGEFGNGNELTINVPSIVINPKTGVITFDVMASHYYDTDADAQQNGAFPISLTLELVNPPTYAKPLNNYSKDLTIDKFKLAVPSEQLELRAFLVKFVDGIKTFPANATLSIVWDSAKEDPATGSIGFSIVTDLYYDENSDPVSQTKAFPIDLVILADLEAPSQTVVDLLPSAPPINSLQGLIDQIVKEGVIDYATFTQYFNITSVPTNADVNITYDPNDLNNTFSVNFTITVTEYYDEEGQNIKSQKEFPFSIRLKHDFKVVSSTFEIWWLLVGILGLLLLTLITYFGFFQYQKWYEIAIMRIKNARRLK